MTEGGSLGNWRWGVKSGYDQDIFIDMYTF